MKKNVISELQRGFSTGMVYADIARNISNWETADLNRSKRIARTEGHRVQCKADLNCAYRARQMGCDTVKQWNAVLDGKTRESHSQEEKESRELEEN
uniref:phage minor head protein n=1 Tax=Eubacterium sp. TaxID=142586 RepID=UPI003FF04EED